MMRIAVAGGGGLGYLIAEELANTGNAYNVVVLSTRPCTFTNPEIQPVQVDYDDFAGLCHALRGVDLVISTVTGDPQLILIQAAGTSRVLLFVPSEFEGKIDKRPGGNDPLDHGSAQARRLLRQWEQSSGMKSTIFSCGVFMERFHPSGLASFNLGSSSGVYESGDYILDLPNANAIIVERNSQGRSVRICMTSIYDVARFVAAAVEIGPGAWPKEYTMRGDRRSLTDLVGICSRELQVPFTQHRLQAHELPGQIVHYANEGNAPSVAWWQRLLATANGRYDFSTATLNDLVSFQPTNFADWLRNIYQA